MRLKTRNAKSQKSFEKEIIRSTSKTLRLSDNLRKSYNAIKRPLAVLLIVIVLISNIFPIPALQTTALGVLGFMIVELLFDIHKQLTEEEAQQVFSDFFSVSFAIRERILEIIERKQSFHIRALGMSMGHAWTFFSNTLLPILQSDKKQIVYLEIAMLDGWWGELPKINPSWASRAKPHYNEIVAFIKNHDKRIKEKGWKIAVYRYKHLPNWHGVLLNNDILFLSTCFWNENYLTGAENLYELVSSDLELGAEKIKQFISWFEYIKSNDKAYSE